MQESFAQNKITFIEPNVSITYDSNVFVQKNRYSNTIYGEAYDFYFKKIKAPLTHIHILAGFTKTKPSKKLQDSIVIVTVNDVKSSKEAKRDLVYAESKPVSINGFSCIGLIMKDNKSDYHIMIKGLSIFEDGTSEFQYISSGRKELDKEYEILKSFLSGFKSYTINQIKDEDAALQKKYTITIVPKENKFPSTTFTGLVQVKERLTNKIVEARITQAHGEFEEMFSPQPDGSMIISCFDKQTGKIDKKGYLVVLNSFGKRVNLPFSFSYQR